MTWLNMDDMAGHVGKWLKTAANCSNWLEMAANNRKIMEMVGVG